MKNVFHDKLVAALCVELLASLASMPNGVNCARRTDPAYCSNLVAAANRSAPFKSPVGGCTPLRHCLGDIPVACRKATQKLLTF